MATKTKPLAERQEPLVTLTEPRPRPHSRIARGKMARVEERVFYLFIAPWLIGFVWFTLGPVAASFYFSFTEWSVFAPPEWIGVRNYLALVTRTPLFWTSLRVTFVAALANIGLGTAISLVMALLLNQRVRGVSLYRTLFFLPIAVSGPATVLVWQWIYEPNFGLANYLLGLIGIPGPQWLSYEWALTSLIILTLWSSIGGPIIIYLAGLQGISQHLLEAAMVDGANTWQRFWRITLPLLSPSIFFNMIITVIASFQLFTPAFMLTQGGPANATEYYAFYLYETAFKRFHMGLGSALAWILFALILMLTLVQLYLARRWVHYE
jgi:multiple sugar transport system permease protein